MLDEGSLPPAVFDRELCRAWTWIFLATANVSCILESVNTSSENVLLESVDTDKKMAILESVKTDNEGRVSLPVRTDSV